MTTCAFHLRLFLRAFLLAACAGSLAPGLSSCARSSTDPQRDRAEPEYAQPIADTRVMTFNIRYASGDKGEHAWANRRDAVAECIVAADPDIIGLQEVEAVQADWLRERFPAHAFHGVGRFDGVRKGEFAPILYRAARYRVLDAGHFWISETPDIPGSKSWNTACERMASWVRLLDRTTQSPIAVINTHLDHVSEEARLQGVRMVREKAEELSRGADGRACPVIVTGDFNTSAGGPLGIYLRGDISRSASQLTLRDAYRIHDPSDDNDEATFNNWKPQESGDRIDWIFATPSFDVVTAAIDRRMPNGVMPSDHYPVSAVLRVRSIGSPTN